MQSSQVLFPIFAMVALTFGVGILMKIGRVRAVRQGLDPAFFKQNRGGRLPDFLVQVTQNYDNLFEMPVLFYTALLLAYVTHLAGLSLLVLAWAFVLMRVVHTAIHIHSNNLRWRANVFMLSTYILAALWLWLLVKMMVG